MYSIALFISQTLWLLPAKTQPDWGFYAHKRINHLSVFLLPPPMIRFYKEHIGYLAEHATDPDMRRYAVADEGPRHYIDIDRYGEYPYPLLPRKWTDALKAFPPDTLKAHGIVPWHIQTMLHRLTAAFAEKDLAAILKNSAEIGHYIADAHVPLHANSNHNGQYSNQRGIHGFWESRVPELLAETEFDFFIGQAQYIPDPLQFTWDRVLESARAADTVLLFEKRLSRKFPSDKKYAFENRNGKLTRQYSSAYTRAYDRMLNGMVERRMRQSIFAIASFWYTAWVNAGQPSLDALLKKSPAPTLPAGGSDSLMQSWQSGGRMIGRQEEGD